MNLYDIGDDLWAIDALLEEQEGDVTECEAAIDEWLNEAHSNLKDKLTGYRKYIANLEASAAGYETELDRLKSLAQVKRNAAARLKDRLFHFMTAHNIDKVETPVGTFAIQKNGGALPVILDPDVEAHPEELPEGYRIVLFKPDKKAIGDALKNGEDLDFASLGDRGTHLRIK